MDESREEREELAAIQRDDQDDEREHLFDALAGWSPVSEYGLPMADNRP